MEVTGFKPGSKVDRAPGPKLAIGERLSICGRFAINAHGHWRELHQDEQVAQPHEFSAIGPDGRTLQYIG